MVFLDHCNILFDAEIALFVCVVFKLLDSQFFCFSLTSIFVASQDDIGYELDSFKNLTAKDRVKSCLFWSHFLEFFIYFEHQSELIDFYQDITIVFVNDSLAELSISLGVKVLFIVDMGNIGFRIMS